MTTSTAPRKQTVARFPGIVGYLVLLLMSGCGLAMDNTDRLDRGEQAYAEGDDRAAILDAKEVLLDEPDNIRARLLLGRASVGVGDGPAAEKEFRKAIELGTPRMEVAADMARAFVLQRKFDEVIKEIPVEGLPSSEAEVTVRVARGDALMGLKKPESAREMYMSALQSQPENLEARLGIVSSFMAEGNVLQARSAMDQILETNADNPRVWLHSGSFNLRVGNFEAAEANFNVALDLASTQGDESIEAQALNEARLQALAGLAESLLDQEDVDAARVHVDKLIAQAPQALQTKSLIARVAYIDNDWTTAQQNLQQILRVAPDYWPAQILLGAVHLRSGNLSQAELYLSKAVAAAPANVRARQLLAETKLQMRKAEEAVAALAPIINVPGADPMSLQIAARASLGQQNVDEAIDYLKRSVEENPGNVDFRLQLATVLMQVGRTEEAQETLDAIDTAGSEEKAYQRDALRVLTAVREQKAVVALSAAKDLAETYSDRAGAFDLLGMVQLALGDGDDARASFDEALRIDPKNMMARAYLAAMDESAGELSSAASRYQDILDEMPDAAWAMYALGRIAFREEDLDEAAEQFSRASNINSENPVYRLSLAKTETLRGNNSTARQLLENDFSATLAHFPSAVLLGALRAEDGDKDGAMEIASELKERYPDNPAAHAFDGDLYLTEEDFANADLAYDKALSLGPVRSHAVRSHRIKRRLGVEGAERPLIQYLEVRPLDNEVRALLAEAYMQSNDLGKSIATYERIVADEPANAAALNNLAWNYYLVDDARAVETAKQALEAMPDNGSIIDTLGWILVQQGSLQEGEALLRQAVELEGGRAEIRYHHAVALSKLGKTDEARKTLDEILAGNEEFSSRKEAESLLAEL